MSLAFLILIFFNTALVSSDTQKTESKNSWNLMSWVFGEYKPLTKDELVDIQEKNKQLRIEIACLKKRIARLEDSSDDESSIKEKID